VDPQQKQFLNDVSISAEAAAHIFPSMAACEAALESGYGTSELAAEGFNLFGMKAHAHPEFGTLSLPTKEFLDDKWIVCSAEWVKYPNLTECFMDRMATLKRLAPHYPHYAAALAAKTAQDYIVAVSQSWSTDPQRAAKVLSIFKVYIG
jgi:flagellum-specific peptidoglycan hydrolase FlgJ